MNARELLTQAETTNMRSEWSAQLIMATAAVEQAEALAEIAKKLKGMLVVEVAR